MVEPEEIVAAATDLVGRARDLEGLRLVVSAGPTHEPIDPVRFIGNRSSGRMGIAIASEAAARGAEVTLVLGPGTIDPPSTMTIVRVETAQEMLDAVLSSATDADVVVMAAAVADFRPSRVAAQKIKKSAGPPEIALEPTPDVLDELGKRDLRAVLVGFAAETTDLEAAGRRKLEEKRLDLIVVNEVGREGTGFGSD